MIEMMPQFLKKLEKLDAVEDCDAEWYFQLVGIPKPSIEFTRNNDVLDLVADAEYYSLEEQEDRMYCLKFKTVRKKDVGNWTCAAKNTAGSASSVARLETVPLTAPDFIKGLIESRLPQETDNKIEVTVKGIPFPQIDWFKDGTQIDFIAQTDKYQTEKRPGGHILTILNCQIELDSGIYKARIYNKGGESFSEAMYTVKGYPPKFIEKPEKVYALANEVAVFAAVVDGDPIPVVTWTKGRNNLFDSDHVKIYYERESDCNFMEISYCKPKDAGTYQVTATNEFGVDTAPVTLIITDNTDDVLDYKTQLRNRSTSRKGSNEDGPGWGQLRKSNSDRRSSSEGPESIKLKHVERDKKEPETIEEETTEKVMIRYSNVFNLK